MEAEENLWLDSPEEDALVIDEGNVEGPLSPLSSADRGEALLSKPLRILVEREEPPTFRVDVEGDDVAVVGAVDATPTSSRRAAECPFPGGRQTNKVAPPIYDVTKEDVVGMEGWGVGTPEKKGEERRGGRGGRVCWNCEGDHLIGDCDLPRNPANIARNRKVFMESRSKGGAVSTSTGPQRRYHEESEATKEVQPGGVLSAELRQALGLSGGQLPMHIYRMRIYGYPPGWLEKVKESSVPLRVYDPRRKDFFANKHFLFEREHIVEYPGFNAPLPRGFVDECSRLNFPPMHESDSIRAYLSKLNSSEAKDDERRRFDDVFGGDDLNRRPRGLLGSPPPKDTDLRRRPPQGLLGTPEREDWTGVTSMESLDTPVVNSGARLGCGRGRFRPSDSSEVGKVGTGRGAALPSHIRLPPSTPKKKEEGAGSSSAAGLLPTPDVPPMDARYLPRVPQSKSLLRKSARPKSPSLLRPEGGGGGGEEEDAEVELVEERPHSPTIVNLPPFVESLPAAGGGGRSMSSSSSTTGGSASYKATGSSMVVDLEKEDGEGDTALHSNVTGVKKASTQEQIVIDLVEDEDDNEVTISSTAAPKGKVPETSTRSSFSSKRRAKRSTVELFDEDSTSLLINERTAVRSSETVGCIDVESDEYIPPSKKSKEGVSTLAPKAGEVVVELESSGEEGSGGASDWEKLSTGSNKRKREFEEPLGRVGGASDSETGDEEVESQPNGDVTLTYKKRKLGGDDEDWETEESPTQQQHTVYESTITANRAAAPTAEFIPANSQLEAMKAVILSTSLEEEEDDDEIAVIGEVKGSAVKSKEKVNYTATNTLPSYDKFAAGMPTMVFEEDGAAPTGRFDKVLDILRQKKANRGK